jgi:hypothetical protein
MWVPMEGFFGFTFVAFRAMQAGAIPRPLIVRFMLQLVYMRTEGPIRQCQPWGLRKMGRAPQIYPQNFRVVGRMAVTANEAMVIRT